MTNATTVSRSVNAPTVTAEEVTHIVVTQAHCNAKVRRTTGVRRKRARGHGSDNLTISSCIRAILRLLVHE
jgi:hypothetical protein